MTRIAGTDNTNTRVANLIYPELSYAIIGVLFEVHNELGNKYQEKHYQRAIAIKLKEVGVPFVREVKLDLTFGSEKLGIAFADFVVDNKAILEVKTVWRISPGDVKQVLRYLKASNLRLGTVANFRHQRLELRRVAN